MSRKSNSTTKVSLYAVPATLKSSNGNAESEGGFPIAYADNIWDVVDKTNSPKLAEVMNEENGGQYDQHTINEQLAVGVADVSELKADVEELKATTAEFAYQIPELQNSVSSVQSDVSDLQSNMSTAQSDISNLQDNVSNLESTVSGLSDDISNLQNDVSSVQNDVSSVQSDVNSIQGDIQTLYETDSNLYDCIAEVQGLIPHNAEQRLSDLETQQLELKAEVDDVKEALAYQAKFYSEEITSGSTINGITSHTIAGLLHQCGKSPIVQTIYGGKVVATDIAIDTNSGSVTISWTSSLTVDSSHPLTVSIIGGI